MASLLIRNLPDSVKASLRKRAADHGRSMEEEARLILTNAVRKVPIPRRGLGTRLAEIGKLAGGFELEIPPRTEMPRKPPFVTDEEWEGR
jgi:plasmid stability protein